MACSQVKHYLIHRVLDEEATEQEFHELEYHVAECLSCKNDYQAFKLIDTTLSQHELPEVSDDFTDRVMARLPKKKEPAFLIWFRAHPLLVSAACFVILMLGYVFSLGQEHAFHAEIVKGNGTLKYAGSHTVIVPKNETIKGDLVVKNGDVKINGKVEGNVILVNSHSLMASAGEVTGHVQEVHRVVGWVWYQIKTFFQQLF